MSTGIRHPARAKVRAEELREAGWSLREIRDRLLIEGIAEPSLTTIALWTDPKRRAQHARLNRRNGSHHLQSGRANFRVGPRSTRWKVERMKLLRANGLGWDDIARVMFIDFPDDGRLSRNQVSDAVKLGRIPRSYARNEKRGAEAVA